LRMVGAPKAAEAFEREMPAAARDVLRMNSLRRIVLRDIGKQFDRFKDSG